MGKPKPFRHLPPEYGELAASGVTAGTYHNVSVTVNAKGLVTAIASGTTPIAKRVVVVADATSITPNASTTDICQQVNTQAAGTLTINAPTGAPVDWQGLILQITTTNVQAISWNAIFHASQSVALPTITSGSGLTDEYAFSYDTDNTRWNLMGTNEGI